ncbi:hypothetical protein E2C01_041785 [Portunus trituberculatus]|uniref:Uncharacterized protein n=1 Tax=Portunus trituberculatus TaxID=210409 RepID=A0A5B7FK41_PORTR|nr:hypothetical protein [Portunus trituberculatus]
MGERYNSNWAIFRCAKDLNMSRYNQHRHPIPLEGVEVVRGWSLRQLPQTSRICLSLGHI